MNVIGSIAKYSAKIKILRSPGAGYEGGTAAQMAECGNRDEFPHGHQVDLINSRCGLSDFSSEGYGAALVLGIQGRPTSTAKKPSKAGRLRRK